MTEYNNENRGSIWKNEKKFTDAHPDFTGSLNVNGVEFWVSAWRRKEGASAKAPALTFSVRPKDEQPTQSISERAMPKRPDPISSGRAPQKQNIMPDDDDMNDRIPF